MTATLLNVISLVDAQTLTTVASKSGLGSTGASNGRNRAFESCREASLGDRAKLLARVVGTVYADIDRLADLEVRNPGGQDRGTQGGS